MGAGLRASLIGLCALLAGACSLVTSLDDFSGGAPDGGGADGSVGPTPVDAGADSQGDAAIAADGGFDCAGATFCDGFERTNAFEGWEEIAANAGASVAITTERSLSGSRALRVSLTSDPETRAWLETRLAAAATIDLSYAFYRTGGERQFNLMALSFRRSGRSVELFPVIADGRISFAEQTFEDTVTYFDQTAFEPVASDRWVRVNMFVSLEDRYITATVDGTRIADRRPLHETYPTTQALVIAGISFAARGAPMVLDIDELKIVVKPPP